LVAAGTDGIDGAQPDNAMSRLRSVAPILVSLTIAATTGLLHCSAGGDAWEDDTSEDAITGVNNTAGLTLAYDKDSHHVRATLKKALGTGESLRIRVRRGTITHESQAALDCGTLAEAPPITGGETNLGNKVVYEGPAVSEELVKLISIYNDPRWYGGHETAEMKAEIEKGPDSIVEACVMHGDTVRARLLTNLAYAWDRGEELARGAAVGQRGIGILARDAGNGGQGGAIIPEGAAYNTIDYARLCEQELGEIPFFKKLAEGKYETFDCRDFVGSNGNGTARTIPGVEGTVIPLTVDGEPQTKCSPGRDSRQSYDCVDKCDEGMFLTASSSTGLGRKASCQPGVTVTTAENSQGSSWVLLCRKVEDTGVGMMKTKRFNDIAIIGNNPKTGKTCFFQNKENIGNDGSRVTHPADVARSSAIWPAQPSSYCTGSCHAADAFVHSPWIDNAKRSDGTPIVPKMGEHPAYPISDLEAPYKLVNGPAQGFEVAPQLVSEDALPCTSCHRVAGRAFAEFAEWSTGLGDNYFNKITESHKGFGTSAFWMPPRLDGYNAQNFEQSHWRNAVKHISSCMGGAPGPECQFAPVPETRRRTEPSTEPPPTGPIPEATLRSVNSYKVVSEQLNCRSGAGTNTSIVARLVQGDTVTAATDGERVRTASDGRPWLRVVPDGSAPCYVSAQYQYLDPH
jgi:hypothetical protein